MIRRLRVKFVVITMTIASVMLALILGIQFRSTREALEAVSIQALTDAAYEPTDRDRPRAPGEGPGISCFHLIQAPQGVVMVEGEDTFDLADREHLYRLLIRAREQGTVTGVIWDEALRFYRSESPFGTKYTFTDIRAEQQTLTSLLHTCVSLFFGGTLLFLGLSILLAGWATAPVERAWRQQRQFVADASHELKTPLTVILTNAELLQDPRYSGEDRSRLAENIRTMSVQMRDLVEELLQLARADSRAVREEMEPLDFSRLTETRLLPFEPLYFEQGLTLESRLEPGIRLTGNSGQLARLLDILLDNGCKYSAPGTTVRVTLCRQGRCRCLLKLESPGTPLTKEACREIFGRFCRGEAHRTMNRSYGLGLSIARETVVAHRGRIWAEPAEGANVFCVVLPLSQM